eukprot:4653084-Pyramimonas_sp.AAC.1
MDAVHTGQTVRFVDIAPIPLQPANNSTESEMLATLLTLLFHQSTELGTVVHRSWSDAIAQNRKKPTYVE